MTRDIQILTTLKCTLNCPRCINHVMENRKDLKWDDFEHFVAYSVTNNIKFNNVWFTGGEPTLWPYLIDAINLLKVHKLTKTIWVSSNGVGKDIRDYGNTDRLRLTDYGSINRLDIYRLLHQFGRRRVLISYCVHLDFPKTPFDNSLPADCRCIGEFLYNGMIYPCSSCARYDVDGISVYEDWKHQNMAVNYNQLLCASCIGNAKVSKYITPRPVLEIRLSGTHRGIYV